MMDIPKIISEFGNGEGESLLTTLFKKVSVMGKDKDKELLNVFMDFDLNNQRIKFTPIPYYEDCEKEWNYFGNNPAAAKQIYAVRDVGGFLNHWTGRPNGILKNLLDFLNEGELKILLQECVDKDLINEKGINVDLIQCKGSDSSGDSENDSDGNNKISIVGEEKKKEFYINEEKVSSEKLLLHCIDGSSKCKILLIIPRVIKDGISVVISTHEDYVKAIESTQSKEGVGTKAVCHICGKLKSDINTKEYSSNFMKSGIGKVFVTTTINYAPSFLKTGHQRNYGICMDCYENLKFGEKRVMEEFKLRIAKEDSIILFEGLDKPINPLEIDGFKKEIDVVFNAKESNEWAKLFEELIMEDQEVKLYQFNIIFYKTDGKSCAIKKTIENISGIHFHYVAQVFEEVRKTFEERLPYFTLGHLYSMVPVATNNKKEQLNIQRLLDLYAAIIKGELVEKAFIFDLAVESLEKGVSEINSSKVRNYKNLYNLEYLATKDLGKDWYINKIIMRYIALFRVLQKLAILDKEVFKVEEKVEVTDYSFQLLEKAEAFLNGQGFNEEARGLFYLGVLTHYIGVAQFRQKHKKKPILDKITYSGMSQKDVLEFYLEILEKIRQYKKYLNIWQTDRIEERLHHYMKDIKLNKVSEKENVFYIMAGYAFCVGNYKKDDIDGVEVEDKEDENNDEE